MGQVSRRLIVSQTLLLCPKRNKRGFYKDAESLKREILDQEPCKRESLTHGFEAEVRGRNAPIVCVTEWNPISSLGSVFVPPNLQENVDKSCVRYIFSIPYSNKGL